LSVHNTFKYSLKSNVVICLQWGGELCCRTIHGCCGNWLSCEINLASPQNGMFYNLMLFHLCNPKVGELTHIFTGRGTHLYGINFAVPAFEVFAVMGSLANTCYQTALGPSLLSLFGHEYFAINRTSWCTNIQYSVLLCLGGDRKITCILLTAACPFWLQNLWSVYLLLLMTQALLFYTQT